MFRNMLTSVRSWIYFHEKSDTISLCSSEDHAYQNCGPLGTKVAMLLLVMMHHTIGLLSKL